MGQRRDPRLRRRAPGERPDDRGRCRARAARVAGGGAAGARDVPNRAARPRPGRCTRRTARGGPGIPGGGDEPARGAVRPRAARSRARDRLRRGARAARERSVPGMTLLELSAAFAVALVVLVVLFLVLATYNAVVALEQRIDKAWANIEVGLKQRWDQLPNLVEAVRDTMSWEREVLTDVARLRAAYAPAASIPAQAATS